MARKLLAGLAGIIAVLGVAALFASPFYKAKNFNDSPLARQIMRNRRQQKADNAKLIKKMKQGKDLSKSKEYKQAAFQAKKHPVHKNFEKYGISQVDIQLARKVKVTAIGDSVMAGSSNNLKALMPRAIVDAAVSRQLEDIFPLVKSYKAKGALADNVIIGLGTNGPIPQSDLHQLMSMLGKKRHVFWINTYVPSKDWQNSVNRLLKSSTKRYHNLTVINWHDYVQKHQNWLYSDNTHPTPEGSKYYSAFVVKQVVRRAKY